MDRGAWWATVHAVTKSRTQLSAHIYSSIKLKKKSLKNTILISDLSDLLSWVIYFSFFKFNFIFWHTEQLAGS